ncbi:MAG: SAM-dependent methyltransferase [Oceanococcus sp.]
MSKEFFDTAELSLNQESPEPTAWGNFGYWEQAQSYPQSCEALARLLADSAELQSTDRVLDLGFGLGEQLRLWRQTYGVSQLVGVNPSQSQCRHAQQLINHDDFALRCSTAEAYLFKQPAIFSKILALDCVYHFQQGPALFSSIASALQEQGLFAWTDMYLHQQPRGAASNLALQLMCRGSRIPSGNLKTKALYQQQLQQAGLQLLSHVDLTEQVFLPFSQWWEHYIRRYPMPLRQRLKYDATARVLKYASAKPVLRYGLFLASKQQN